MGVALQSKLEEKKREIQKAKKEEHNISIETDKISLESKDEAELEEYEKTEEEKSVEEEKDIASMAKGELMNFIKYGMQMKGHKAVTSIAVSRSQEEIKPAEPEPFDYSKLELIEHFKELEEGMLCELVGKFFIEYSLAATDDINKKNVLMSVMNAINAEFPFRLIARFEYEVDPNDIARPFKPFSLKNKDEVDLQW